MLARRKCPKCKIVWNPQLFTGCPLCGRGPNRVWVVLVGKQIHSLYRDPDDAKWAENHLKAEHDNVTVEDYDIQ